MVLSKLLRNAVKFSKPNENIQVKIKKKRPNKLVKALDRNQKSIFYQISVINYGDQIDEKKVYQMTHVFPDDKCHFQRAHLGLPFSNAIVQELGCSQFQIKSENGKTKISFFIAQPLNYKKKLEQEELFIMQRLSDFKLVNSQNLEAILLVDDEPGIHRTLNIMLDGKYQIVFMSNGLEVKEKFNSKNFPFQKIILDYEMPLMDGPEIAHYLRSKGYQGLIIGHTAITSQQQRQQFLQSGANYVFLKPTKLSDLLQALNGRLRFNKKMFRKTNQF